MNIDFSAVNENKKFKITKIILKTIVVIISLLFFVWFLLPLSYNVFDIGNIVGIMVCVFSIFLCVGTKLIKKIKTFFYKKPVTQGLWIAGRILVIVFYLYIAVITSIMMVAQLLPGEENSTVVVLGAQVRNGAPSMILQGRIDAAFDYLNSNPDSHVVCTGGQGKNESMSEADCIEKELLAQGIDSDRIFKEVTSINTKQNFENAKQVIEENELNENIVIATDGFHQLRARIIARNSGFEDTIGAHSADTFWVFAPAYYVREWLAIPVAIIFE